MKNKQEKITDLRLWFILFMGLNLVFAFYHAVFFWGNHDWDWVKGTSQVLSLDTGMFEGRYAKFLLNVSLFSGQILPLLNNLIAFALFVLGAVWLTNYWQIKKFLAKLITALMVITAPYILGWLYFPINILGNFSAIALVAYGLTVAERDKSIYKILSVICFLLALGVYPSVAEMMIICFAVRYIIAPAKSYRQILNSFYPLLVALIIFKLLLFVLGKLDIVYTAYYNMQTLSIIQLWHRIPQMMKLIITQLSTTLPFLDAKYKAISLLLLVLAIVSTLKQGLWWCVALGATVLSSFLTALPEETAYMPRINFYGLNFLIAGAVAVLLKQKQSWCNFGYIFSILIIWSGIISDIEATKVWQLGKTAENNLVERISTEIEQQAPDKILIPIIAGELPLRPRYYTTPYQKESPYILNGSLMVRHIPSGMFNFYAPTPLFYNYSQIADLSPELHHFITRANRSWPAQEALYVDDKYAVILLTKEGVSAIQAQLPY